MHPDEPVLIAAMKACSTCRPFEGVYCAPHDAQLAAMYPDVPECGDDCCVPKTVAPEGDRS